MGSLIVKIHKPEGTQVITLPKSHLTVGRSSICDVQLDDQNIGQEHLRIWYDNGHLWGQDLGTEHGTNMNGSRMLLLRPVLFRDTDAFQLGGARFSITFQYQNTTDAKPAPTIRTLGEPPPLQKTPPKLPVDDSGPLKEENQKLRLEIARLKKTVDELNRPSAEEITSISQVKRNALKELETLKAAEIKRFETLKKNSVGEIERRIIARVHNRGRKLISQPEIESDVSAALRHILLGEAEPPIFYHANSIVPQGRLMLSFLLAALIVAGFVYYSTWKSMQIENPLNMLPNVIDRSTASKPKLKPNALPVKPPKK